MNTVYNISSNTNNFEQCGVSEYAGVFYLYYSPFYDYMSTFEGNGGVAGAITCEGCKMYLYDTIFQFNSAWRGMIELREYAYMYAYQVQFYRN